MTMAIRHITTHFVVEGHSLTDVQYYNAAYIRLVLHHACISAPLLEAKVNVRQDGQS